MSKPTTPPKELATTTMSTVRDFGAGSGHQQPIGVDVGFGGEVSTGCKSLDEALEMGGGRTAAMLGDLGRITSAASPPPTGTRPQTTNRWSQPVDVKDVDLAFPATVIGRFLPPESEIPAEFRLIGKEWTAKANKLFCNGGAVDLKPGTDPERAFRQLRACLGSFEPTYEHKELGVGYLLSLWCRSPR